MIHYQLRCSAGHGFEGWFRDAAGFDEQSARGLLNCPDCGTQSVTRAMMAPAVRSSRRRRVAEAAAPVAAAPPGPDAGVGASAGPAPGRATGARAATGDVAVLPDEVRAVLQRIRAGIERHCEDVGDRFADVARAEHRKAADEPERAPRGIYGQATAGEVEALADEGIEVNRIPWLPRADS
nr:DUF1178 family protein [uncultured Lichenicoccus sp.]